MIDKRNIEKRKQKTYLVKEDKKSLEKYFDLNKDIDYYNPDAYNKKDNCLLNDNLNINFTSIFIFST